jgi:hypothetical protein
MSATDYATLAVAVTVIVSAFAGAVRWLVKHYFYELKPNGGSSLRDAQTVIHQKVDRIEEKQDRMEEKQDKQSERIDRIFELLSQQKNG